ncbi:MAG: heme lyase NrfEFG subunit NrfF [Providencia sp.]|jgi:cytochrome c nitrite reductase accessory protein NrfF|nr:heme lyase NrfEFG subunit NrfF [Providencia sp.]
MINLLRALFLLLISAVANAQIVDTWQFNSAEEQEYSLQIASQLRCPQCQNQNLLESNAPTAVSMRHQVYKMVSEGKSQTQIVQYMTDRYGDFVLYNPPINFTTAILWILPFFAFCLISYYLIRAIRTQRKQGSPQSSVSQSEQLLEIPEINPNRTTWNRKLNALLIVLFAGITASFFLLPRFQLTYDEYQRISDPINAFTPLEQEQNDLLRLQNDIRQSPKNGELWAILGEYYLYQNSFDNALIAYQRALKYTGENAQLYSAIATVLYYQAGQHLTDDTLAVINKALSLDNNEVTALMLLASDAFMNADYDKAIRIWQTLLDSNSPRINRAQLIEAIQMAKIMNNNNITSKP